MALLNHEKEVVEILAKYSFIEQCKEAGIITLQDYVTICNGWGEKTLELIKLFLKRLDQYHEDTRRFIDELKQNSS